ncbi:hypothetical protein ABZ468_07700 [Streptomyces sp. NPDC005708]|uniref:hypothetical protein n=1 Tax=Streptomyces sp. NPDC005708 TaxID=3154564 RepID=UPI0033FA7F3E
MAEQWPTGAFGNAEPVSRPPLPPLPERPPERRPIRGWTLEEQAEHLAALEADLAVWWPKGPKADRKRAYSREHARQTAGLRRHLRAVPDQAQPDTDAA